MGSWTRNAAISCAIACGALIAGPGVVGIAVASADLFGIDVDIPFIGDDDDDKKSDHPSVRVGADLGGFVNAAVPQPGSGGGGALRGAEGGRPSTLPPVPTEPSTRSVVIRAEPPADVAAPAPVMAPPLVAPVVPVVPPVVPMVSAPPVGPLAPVAPPAPAIQQPRADKLPAPADSVDSRAIPESFRAGYAEQLRAATVASLLAVALPGVAGIMAITAAGGVVGYRQARAAQTLPPVNIARFLQ